MADGTEIDRETLTEMLCREAVRRHRSIEAAYADNDAETARVSWIGQLVGLRIAICYLHGWDPSIDADKEGRADELITDWWQRNNEIV